MKLIDVDVSIEKMKSLPIELDAETIQRCIEVLSNMPSADRPRWIPCSERVPACDESLPEYIVTDGDGRLRHCYEPGAPGEFATVEEGMLIKAVAWMPLPEPWKGEAE